MPRARRRALRDRRAPSLAVSGELLDRFTVGSLDVRVTRSCARRDLYDVRAPGALPIALRAAMVARTEGATLAGNDLLWVIDVPMVVAGLHLGSRTTVIRLSSGELVIHSPSQIDEATWRAVEGLGRVSALVAPNLQASCRSDEGMGGNSNADCRGGSSAMCLPSLQWAWSSPVPCVTP